MDPVEIRRKFATQRLTPKDLAKIDLHVSKAIEFADVVNGQCPDNEAKRKAISKIEEALLWANKAVTGKEELA